MRLTQRQLNRATLARQLLLERADAPVVDAVHGVVALQAQEPASPYVAMWNRVTGFDPADLDAAFAERAVVKATLMRITVHAVHGDDHPTFHRAMLQNLRASRLNDRRYTATGLTAADADKVAEPLIQFLGEPRGKAEIEPMLAGLLGMDEVEPRLWWALRRFVPLHIVPSGGPWSFGGEPLYLAAPAPAEPIDEQTALQHLIRRYLEGFGPASAADFAQFSLQRQSEIRPAIDAMADTLETYEGPNGAVLYDVPDSPLPDEDAAPPSRLLGMWDSVLLAYKDRSRVIPEEYRAEIICRNGDVLPTVLVDGLVAGVWRPAEGGIEVTVFQPLPKRAWDGLAAEAAELLQLLACDPKVYGRYLRWWDKLPDGEPRLLTG
jgi:hypothetical protein